MPNTLCVDNGSTCAANPRLWKGNQISAEGGRVGDPQSWERLLSAWISGALPEAHRAHINFMQYSDSLILKSTKGCPWMITCQGEKAGAIPILVRPVLADVALLFGDVRSMSIKDQ